MRHEKSPNQTVRRAGNAEPAVITTGFSSRSMNADAIPALLRTII